MAKIPDINVDLHYTTQHQTGAYKEETVYCKDIDKYRDERAEELLGEYSTVELARLVASEECVSHYYEERWLGAQAEAQNLREGLQDLQEKMEAVELEKDRLLAERDGYRIALRDVVAEVGGLRYDR